MTEFAKETKRTTGLRLVCETPRHVGQYIPHRYPWGSAEYWAKYESELEAWCKEFHEFIRDHRSQDTVELSVERATESVCSHCKKEWETFANDDGIECCASCETPIEGQKQYKERMMTCENNSR